MKTKKELKALLKGWSIRKYAMSCIGVLLIICSCQKQDEVNQSEEALITDTTLDFEQQREEEFIKDFVSSFGTFSKQVELLTEIGAAEEPLLFDHIVQLMNSESGKSSEVSSLALLNDEMAKETNGMEQIDVLFDLGNSGEIDVENMLFAFLPIEEDAPYMTYDIKGNRLGNQESIGDKSVLFFDRYGWHTYLNEMDAINKAYVSEGALDLDVYSAVKKWQDMTEDQIEESLKASISQKSAKNNRADILGVGKVKAKELKGGNRRPEVYAVISGVDQNLKAFALNVPLKFIKAEGIYNFPVGTIQRRNGIPLAKWADFGIENASVLFFERNRKAGFFRQVINFVKGFLSVLKEFNLFQGSIFNNVEAFVNQIDKVVPTVRKDDLLDSFRINSKSGTPITKGKPFPRRAKRLGALKNMEVTFINRQI